MISYNYIFILCWSLALASTQLIKREGQLKKLTEQMILEIVPASKSCDGAEYPKECRTAGQALQPIKHSFFRYHIDTINEAAALISLMGWQSVGFKQNRYRVKGNQPQPGMGCRNMQNGDSNKFYLATLPEFTKQMADVPSDLSTVDKRSKYLDILLTNDDVDFGAASDYLRRVCSDDIQRGLQIGDGLEAWKKYMKDCVKADPSEDMEKEYKRAVDVIMKGQKDDPLPTEKPSNTRKTSFSTTAKQDAKSSSTASPTSKSASQPPAAAWSSTPCPGYEGGWTCTDGQKYVRCINGFWSSEMKVADGTRCKIGFASTYQLESAM